MLTRRAAIVGAGSLCFVAAGGVVPKPRTAVGFEVPPGSCDAHVHVIGDPQQFPMARDRDYTPPPATADDLALVLKSLGIDRVVIVTPTIYDADNSATLAAISRLGRARARGVAFISNSMSSEVLDRMKDAGIAGIRLFLSGDKTFDPVAARRHLRDAIDVARTRNWHLQIATPPDVVAVLRTELAASPVPIVLDCFGWAAGGVDQPGFNAILALVGSGRAYVKFAEPYRLSKRPPDYPDLLPVVRALFAANVDRLLWGSGWPYVSGSLPDRSRFDLAPDLPMDAAQLLNLMADWIPDPSDRRRILVDNPARLYGFPS